MTDPGAADVAQVLGLSAQAHTHVITAHVAAVSDALTWADQTTGPAGQDWSMAQRVEEMLRRCGPSPHALAHPHRVRELTGAVERTERRRRQHWTSLLDLPLVRPAQPPAS